MKGLPAISPASFIALNTGLSDSLSRIHSEIASRMIDSRNGIRQPQAANSSGGIRKRQLSTTAMLSTKPPATLAWMKLV